MTLDSISRTLNVQTDKGSGREGYHNYLVCYEKYVSPIRENVKTLLEFGTAQGGSLNLWSEYFTNAKIHALELEQNNIDCCMGHINKDRVTIHKGDYTDQVFLNKTLSIVGDNIDIVVDDADHYTHNQITALNFWGKHLSINGFYFLEDVYFTERPAIFEALKSSDLELVEDYASNSGGHGYWRMLVLKRKKG